MNLDGRMMDFPLTITHILEHGRAIFGNVEVVTQRPDKSLVRQTFAQTYERAEKLARATVFIAHVPRTSTGKFFKAQLRTQYRDLFMTGSCHLFSTHQACQAARCCKG